MFDRLGDFLRDYIDDDEQDIFSSPEEQMDKENLKYNASQNQYKEQSTKNDYTEKNKKTESTKEKFTFTQNQSEKTEFKFDTSKQQSEYKYSEKTQQQKNAYTKIHQNKSQSQQKKQSSSKRYYVPFELYEDFKTLCLMPGTNLEECKIAYKSLLKKFHPDKFANEIEKQKEATEITSSITSAFTRIKTWYEQNLPKF